MVTVISPIVITLPTKSFHATTSRARDQKDSTINTMTRYLGGRGQEKNYTDFKKITDPNQKMQNIHFKTHILFLLSVSELR